MVLDGWDDAFKEVELRPVDLQNGLEVARATHADYASRVIRAAQGCDAVALCGWSMGGLVVLEAAQSLDAEAVVLIEPSPPAEVQGRDESVEPAAGTFDPELVYGPFPEGLRARPESLLARGERKRGISIPGLPCRSLVVAGAEFREERGESVARHLGSALIDFPGLGHWDLVRAPGVRRAVANFLGVAWWSRHERWSRPLQSWPCWSPRRSSASRRTASSCSTSGAYRTRRSSSPAGLRRKWPRRSALWRFAVHPRSA